MENNEVFLQLSYFLWKELIILMPVIIRWIAIVHASCSYCLDQSVAVLMCLFGHKYI